MNLTTTCVPVVLSKTLIFNLCFSPGSISRSSAPTGFSAMISPELRSVDVATKPASGNASMHACHTFLKGAFA